MRRAGLALFDHSLRKSYGLTVEGVGGRRDIAAGQGEEQYSWRLGVCGL